MSDEQLRPNPDELLKRVQEEEARIRRGKLKIFLGYVAGVGKTFAMLEAAHQRHEEGIDVVIGYVETHGRAETEGLVQGLELIPRKRAEHRGITVSEMDLDTVLARRPTLVLVDELAHTNIPGSRHSKRYQDVEELLAAGIDVYTTLNIQHLESLNDVVAQITGVIVRETIPDWVIDEAGELEMIDLPPEELQQRLKEGKVYVPDQAARAIEKFFRRGNLTALREMALRRVAERVGDQMRAYMQVHAIPGPWHAEERILVCISPNALAERLVRSARRLADELDADWSAIYVETADHARLSEAERDRVARSLRLADELGARTTRIPATSVAETVIHYARTHNITKIVVGKPLRPYWVDVLRGSVVDHIIRRGGNIDVYVISTEAQPDPLIDALKLKPHGPWPRYLSGLVAVAVVSLCGELIKGYLAPTNLVMLYLMAVVFVAVRWGRGPAVLTSLLSVLAFDFFLVPPHYTFAVSDFEYFLTFFGLLAVGLVISTLAAQAQEQARVARRRQAQTAALYDLSRELAGTALMSPILDVIITYVSRTFSCQAAILLPENEQLAVRATSSDLSLSADELAVADWVFHHEVSAGRGTDTLPAADASYFPLKTSQGTVGVLGVISSGSNSSLTPEQRRFLEASTSLAALAVERAELAERARRVQLMQETEKLQTALLNSISHDLRTPLASITGALSSLYADESILDESTRCELIETALGEAERLNQLVGNLLDMSRLEAATAKVARQPCDVEDVVGVALHEVEARLSGREVIIDIPSDLPAVPMDLILMARVLVNVLDNAIKYSQPDTSIDVKARPTGTEIQIEIGDHGTGIPPEDLARVFDKFYRVQRPDNVNGTGLGLSISKGIVEAHGGRIWAENRPSGGTAVTLALPLGELAGLPKGQPQ